MINLIKCHIIAFVLSQFSTREMREIVAELSLNPNQILEIKDVQFARTGRFKDRILIDFGALHCEIAESDFLKLIDKIEKEEEIINHLPAQKK